MLSGRIDINKRITIDLLVIVIILAIAFIFFGKIDVLEKIVELSRAYEDYEIDEIVSTAMVFVVLLLVFSFRRILDLNKSKMIIQERNLKIENALNEIKQLKGILPMCMHCFKVRDDSGYWNKVEAYIEDHSNAEVSHSLCPECAEKYYPDYNLCDE